MSITYRLKRLIKSDAHALVQGLEEPKWVLAQAIRDMESELEQQEQQIKQRQDLLEGLQLKKQNSETMLKSLEADIDFAIDEKQAEISKTLIRKKLILENQLVDLKQKLSEIQKEVKNLQADFAKNKQSYENICARSEHLNLEKTQDDAFSSAEKLIPKDEALDHQVELEFLKRMKKNREVRHEK